MTARPRVHQVLATLGYGDAIGHEVLGVQRVLQGAGYESEIFVETADHRLEDRTIDYREMVGAIVPEDVLIHHFSIGSRASRTAYALPGRMALVYHNITPPHYFVGVHRDLVKQCFRGRRELTAYIERSDLALGDSEYNRRELEGLGFPRTGVLPVVPDFSHLGGSPSPLLAAGFDDGWTNVMFVGRVIPNKRFETVVRAFHVYRTRHNPRARLLFVGSYSGFERYLAMLQELIASLGTPDVHFLGHVSNEELSALYDVADLFLCASAHEGFCVPIIEAFHKGVPVLAYASTAVPATMDGGGVLYDTSDPFEIARLMDAVLDDPAIEESVLRSQEAALARLLARDFAGTLLGFVDQIIARPPRPAPAVAWDFWAQFDQFERFEELRQFRPALFQALPASAPERFGAARGSRLENQDSSAGASDDDKRLAARGSRLENGAQASARTTPNGAPQVVSSEPPVADSEPRAASREPRR